MARPKFKLFAAAAAPWLVTGAIGLTSGASRTRLGAGSRGPASRLRLSDRSGCLTVLAAILAALSAAALFAAATALQHRSAGLVSAAGTETERRADAGSCARRSATRCGSLGTGRGHRWRGTACHRAARRAAYPGPAAASHRSHLCPGFAPAPRAPPPAARPSRMGRRARSRRGAVFLAVATPANGSAQPPDLAPTVLCGALIGLGIVGCYVASRRTTADTAAVLLGTAAGLTFAAAAGLLKETMDILNRGAGALVMAWPPFALVAVGAIGVVLNQLAYQAGPLSFSLPAITIRGPGGQPGHRRGRLR